MRFDQVIRFGVVVFGIIAFSLIISVNQSYAKRIFKLGHIDPDDPFIAPDQAAAVVFKNMVMTATNGEIEVQIFPSSVLGKERESMEMVKNGLVQGYLASAGAMAFFWPVIGILDTPFAIPNFSIAYDVFDGWFGEKLKRSFFEKTGIRCLEITDASGFFNFTNNKKQIRSAEDVKGIKFRSMALPSHIAFFKAMGATAIPISWAEVYTSLQTGVVDGQHNPLGQIIQNKIYEVQKYLSLTNHIFSTHWFLVNKEFMLSLPIEQQKIISDAALVAKIGSRGITRIVASTDKGIPFLAKHMEIYQPSAKEKETFAAVTIPAMRAFIRDNLGETGISLQNDFLKAIEDSKQKLGY
jgi:TRAP-type transport system periplasmic protein